jgi:hypothetical protein
MTRRRPAVGGAVTAGPDLDWVNFNDPAHPDFDWSEATAVRDCRGAAPSAFRSLISANLSAQVTASFDNLPALPSGPTAIGTLTTTAGSFNVDAFRGQSFQAPRSGRLDVQVSQEPPATMCPRILSEAPMTGASVVTGRCLGDGLVAALLQTI